MSEHERRVNDQDIQAYEKLDTHNLYSKVIGFGGDNKLDKYIDKSMQGSKSQHNSPVMGTKKMSADGSPERNSKLAKIGQLALNQSQNGTARPAGLAYNDISMTKLQRIKENMDKPDAIRFRANTNNRGYGFEQTISKNGPSGKQVVATGEDNPYNYNYMAPGNY